MSSGTATATAPAPPTMKLLVDTGAQRVVLAEAGKDVVDFLFGLLAMPLGAADRLLTVAGDGGGALGSIANVYASVKKMDARHMHSAAARDALLLDPAAPPRPSAATDLSFSEPALFLYRCDACRAARLPKGNGGFVKDLTTYTVTDDLTVAPTVSGASTVVALLKSLGVRDLGTIEERTVNVGREEALGILKAALHSKTVLTDAFLTKRTKRETYI
ncbi:unnamed protein product [Urochloa humidicola]